MKDVLHQYETVTHLSDSQLRFLIGVTEFLSCAYRHQDDHRRRAARRHRGAHATDHLAVVCDGHGRHLNDSTRWMQLIIFSLIMLAISLIPAALGPQTGLVVIIRAAQPVADSVRADRSRLRCVAYGWLCLASSPRMGTASSDSAYGT
jgi:hypothetical protein